MSGAGHGDGRGDKVGEKIGGKFISRRYLLPTFFARSLCFGSVPAFTASRGYPLIHSSSSPFLFGCVLRTAAINKKDKKIFTLWFVCNSEIDRHSIMSAFSLFLFRWCAKRAINAIPTNINYEYLFEILFAFSFPFDRSHRSGPTLSHLRVFDGPATTRPVRSVVVSAV